MAALSLPLLLCSCRALAPPGPAIGGIAQNDSSAEGAAESEPPPPAAGQPAKAPNETRARGGVNSVIRKAIDSAGPVPIIPVAPRGLPIPQGIVTPWKPPGIDGPWPADEYLWDGGEKYPVVVDSNLEIKGLALEDTIVHYDTIDGRTVVKPSNRVVIYSPRFGAVREVTAALASQQEQGPVQAEKPVGPVQYEEDQLATTALQPVQPVGEIGTKLVSIEKGNQLVVRVSNRLQPATMEDHLLPFEDFEIVRLGMFAQSEQTEVQERVEAAVAWTADQAAQVILEKQTAHVEVGDQRAQATFTIDTPNHPCLRLIKLASTATARPGEFVDFTIRFDNVGDQKIGNVTLVDNLTTRLEYVDGTAQSSLTADFSASLNEGDSMLLRWEFADPIEAGAGGIVRFRCRVR
jgi:uncharacterized repeat protein (TIGR01451 family)